MSFFNLLKPKVKEETSLIYDIASGSIGAALVSFVPNHAPSVIFTDRQSILLKKKPTSADIISEMVRALTKISKSISDKKIKIKRIFFVFSSPWVISQTRIIDYKKDKDVLVTEKLINTIIRDEELKSIGTGTKRREGFLQDFGLDTVLVEHKAIAVTLNGYPTPYPNGKKAHFIEIPLVTSSVGGKILEIIDRAISPFFSSVKIINHSSSLLSYSVLRDIFENEYSFLSIDINGEVTDIYIVKDGVLLHNASFPLGINMILRHMSDALGYELSVCESLLQVYNTGKIDQESGLKVKVILESIQKQWIELFHESISSLGNDIALPRKLFLTVSNNLSSFFAEFLRSEKFSQLNLTSDGFSVEVVDMSKLNQYCHFNNGSRPDTLLAIEAIAINKLYI
ncbi:MAG: hypothetical protein EXS50_00785 [Candidatus Taylorbacteria bacterium]|nr:hypothetical protein [Candidatus Taylorbacteria bacterium]